jgi:hypothetical protein
VILFPRAGGCSFSHKKCTLATRSSSEGALDALLQQVSLDRQPEEGKAAPVHSRVSRAYAKMVATSYTIFVIYFATIHSLFKNLREDCTRCLRGLEAKHPVR